MEKSLADAFDSYINWIVAFFLLTALNLAMEAGAYLSKPSLAVALRSWAHWPARVGSAVLLVAFILWAWRSRGRSRRTFLDGYAVEAIKRSALFGFLLTLGLVAILDVITNTSQLPADFYIKLPGLSLTAGFGLSFFLFNFLDKARDPDEVAGA